MSDKRCDVCGAPMLHTNNEMCKNYHLQKEPMTSSSEQPPKEYIITEEQLLIVEHGCIYPDKDGCIGNRCKYHDPNPSFRDNVVCLLNEHDIANGVRSRPHPAPVEHEGIPDFFGAPVSHGHLYSDKFMKKHDAAIISKAREEYAEKVKSVLNQKSKMAYEDGDMIRGSAMADAAIVCESIRSTTPQSEQAGDKE